MDSSTKSKLSTIKRNAPSTDSVFAPDRSDCGLREKIMKLEEENQKLRFAKEPENTEILPWLVAERKLIITSFRTFQKALENLKNMITSLKYREIHSNEFEDMLEKAKLGTTLCVCWRHVSSNFQLIVKESIEDPELNDVSSAVNMYQDAKEILVGGDNNQVLPSIMPWIEREGKISEQACNRALYFLGDLKEKIIKEKDRELKSARFEDMSKHAACAERYSKCWLKVARRMKTVVDEHILTIEKQVMEMETCDHSESTASDHNETPAIHHRDHSYTLPSNEHPIEKSEQPNISRTSENLLTEEHQRATGDSPVIPPLPEQVAQFCDRLVGFRTYLRGKGTILRSITSPPYNINRFRAPISVRIDKLENEFYLETLVWSGKTVTRTWRADGKRRDGIACYYQERDDGSAICIQLETNDRVKNSPQLKCVQYKLGLHDNEIQMYIALMSNSEFPMDLDWAAFSYQIN